MPERVTCGHCLMSFRLGLHLFDERLRLSGERLRCPDCSLSFVCSKGSNAGGALRTYVSKSEAERQCLQRADYSTFGSENWGKPAKPAPAGIAA